MQVARGAERGRPARPRTSSTHIRLRRRHVGPRAPGRDQGRSRSPRRPRAAGQPAVRGDESAADAALHLREGLLCSRGHRESDQGTARWVADRPHELLSVLGEPVARLPDRRGLRAHAGTAIAGGAYCVCPQPGDVAARPAAEAAGSTSSARSAAWFCICRARRRTSRRGGTSHSRWARAPDSPPVAPRPPASWAAWAAPPAGLSLPNPRVRHAPPGRLLKPRLRAGSDVRDPFLRRSRPLAVESGPS